MPQYTDMISSWDMVNHMPVPTEQAVRDAVGLRPEEYGNTAEEREDAIKVASVACKSLLTAQMTKESKMVLEWRLFFEDSSRKEFGRLVGITLQCFLRGNLATELFADYAKIPTILKEEIKMSTIGHRRYTGHMVLRALSRADEQGNVFDY